MHSAAPAGGVQSLPHVGFYKCACGYLYTVGNCTYPMEVRPCPEGCGRNVGGQDHRPAEGQQDLRGQVTMMGAPLVGYNMPAVNASNGKEGPCSPP